MCVCIYTNICMRNVYNLYIYITHKYWESSLCYMLSTCWRLRVLLTEAALDWMTSCHTHWVSPPTMWIRLVIFLSPKCLRGNAVWWSRSGQGWWMGFLPRYQQHGCLLAWSADREAQVKESEAPTEPVPPENESACMIHAHRSVFQECQGMFYVDSALECIRSFIPRLKIQAHTFLRNRKYIFLKNKTKPTPVSRCHSGILPAAVLRELLTGPGGRGLS